MPSLERAKPLYSIPVNTRLIPQLQEEKYAVLPVGRVSGELPAGVGNVHNIFSFNLFLHLDQSGGDPRRFARINLKDFLAGLSSDDGEHYYYDASIAPGAASEEYETPIHVLVVDQFEEIFTTHLERWQDRADFFQQLEEVMATDPLLWVVLSLREDYAATLDPYAPLLANRMRARFYMQRMGYETALEAVRRPTERYGRPFAPAMAEQLVDNLRQIRVHEETTTKPGQFVEPVQLQVVCYQLWEKLKDREPGPITAEDLQQSGDVDTALADFYGEAIARVVRASGISEIALREWFNQKLITEARTRGTVYMGETQTAGLPNEVVRSLADQYLLRAEMRAGGIWYELVHDRFVEPILQANEHWLQRQNRLVQDALAWAHSDEDENKLYLGERLQEALTNVGQHHQEPVVAAFLDASQAKDQALTAQEAARQRELEATQKLAEERERAAMVLRRRAWVLAGVGVVSLLAAIIAIWFYLEAGRAKGRADAEKQSALRGQSLFLADLARQQNEKSNFTVGMLLALEALPKSMARPDRPYVPEADAQLYEAAVNQRERSVLTGHGDEVNHVAFSPDGSAWPPPLRIRPRGSGTPRGGSCLPS